MCRSLRSMLNRITMRVFPSLLVIQKAASLRNIASDSDTPTSITKLGHSSSMSREQGLYPIPASFDLPAGRPNLPDPVATIDVRTPRSFISNIKLNSCATPSSLPSSRMVIRSSQLRLVSRILSISSRLSWLTLVNAKYWGVCVLEACQANPLESNQVWERDSGNVRISYKHFFRIRIHQLPELDSDPSKLHKMTRTQHHSPRHGLTPSWRYWPWTSTQYTSTLGNKHSIQKTIASSQSQNTKKLTERNYIQFSKTPRTWLTKAMTATRNNFHDCQRRELGSWNDCRDRKATVPQSSASHPKNWDLHWKELQTLLPQRNLQCSSWETNAQVETNAGTCTTSIHLSTSICVECSTLQDDWKWFNLPLVRRDILPSEIARWRQERTEWNGDRAKTTQACPRKTLSVVQLLSISSRADWCFHSDWYFLSPSGLCLVSCFSTRQSNTYWWRVVRSCLFFFFSVVSMLQVLPIEDYFSSFSTYAAFRVKLAAKYDMACCSELLSLPYFLRFAWNNAPTLNELRRLVALLQDWSR